METYYGQISDKYSFEGKGVTPEFMCGIANEILIHALKEIGKNRKHDEIYEEFCVLYKEFFETYPLVLKWIILTGKFNKESFMKLLKHTKFYYSDPMEYNTIQVDHYILDTYKKELFASKVKNVHHHVKMRRQEILSDLEKENKKLKIARKLAEEETKKINEEYKNARKQRLIKYIKENKDQLQKQLGEYIK